MGTAQVPLTLLQMLKDSSALFICKSGNGLPQGDVHTCCSYFKTVSALCLEKGGKNGNQVRMKTKLEGIGISRANTYKPAVNVLKGSPWTKITRCSLALKEGTDMHNWGSDHMLQSEFRTGWWRCDWVNFRQSAFQKEFKEAEIKRGRNR